MSTTDPTRPPDTDRRSTHGPVARVVGVMGSLRWWVLAAALLSAVTFVAGIGLISLAGNLISRSALIDTTATLTLAIVGVRFFAVTRAVGRYLERYVGHLGTFRILTRIRVWTFRGIEPSAPASLMDRRAGDVVTRIVDDVDTLQDLALRVLAPPIAAAIACGAGAGVLGVLDPRLGIVLVVFVLLAGVAVPWSTRRMGRAAAERLTAEQAELHAVSVESVTALADLVAYGREDLLGQRLDALTERRRGAERRLANARGLNLALAGALSGLAAGATLAVAVPFVTNGTLEPVLLAVVPLAALATFEAVAPLTVAAEHLDRARASAARLTELVDTAPAVLDPAPEQAAGPFSGAGAVEFDGVRFRYDADGPDVLADTTFTIPAGARVAVVGPSGSGKSTIAALLLRFWEPQSGTIRIDGIDLRTVAAEQTRAAVAVVAQQDHLFDTTVRDNLLLGDADADDDRLRAVLAAVALDDWLESVPGGLTARTGENGARLSGGERQRLMIARALLAESPILVLDESTAHLDPATERRVLEGVDRWRAGRTTVHIAHHGESLRAELVLSVDGGRFRPVPR
ncbi:MAG: thiol reductant ABC exporter subunit CydC [Microthrixaceae bacterium]